MILPRIHHSVQILKTLYEMIESLILHVYRSWLNKRTLSQTVFVFLRNSVPIIIWLLLFNSIALIPNKYKPDINVRLAMRLDDYIFNNLYGAIMTLLCLILGSVLLYFRYFHHDTKSINKPKDLEYSQELIKDTKNRFWENIPLVMILGGWVLLNVIYYFKEPINKVKNIVALVFYIIGHVLIIPGSVWYFYLFQPPKLLRLFAMVLGIHNIIISVVHLLFPNVPPIYIQYYGQNKIPDYDSPGYSEGLTRMDTNFGFGYFLNFFIIYVKSNEFGILPSLHSSMSILTVLFLIKTVKYSILKVVFLAYLCCQVWSSIYLDHHWRIDILFSFIYSLLFYLQARGKINSIQANFKYGIKFGDTTMGMRLFQNTFLESWFNPT